MSAARGGIAPAPLPRPKPWQPWRARPYSYAAAQQLSRQLGLSPVTASVLARRGFEDVASARAFLEASETHDPLAFAGMDEAVALMLSHTERGNPIAIHGDYDVDGVCSAALACSVLRDLGAEVRVLLPSRMEDGYGLSIAAIDRLHAQGARLLVTTDCGIGAVEEVAHARRLGMDVVVTDHHRPGAELPDCPIVHPTVCGYPCADLCATGVVYKMAQALQAAAGGDPARVERELDIVALATVADVVSLLGENRTLVRQGLRLLTGAPRPGLRALMKVAGLEPQSVTEHTLGFVLAPRINAAGRLYRADAGLELMLTQDEARATQIARELDAINVERQSVETGILFEAERAISSDGVAVDPLHVIAGEGWHPGVIGIVASRLVERYHRPCVLVSVDDAGRGRGSGRSIPPYDLHAGLSACAGHLTRFGGHRMAAGLEIEAAGLAAFRREIVEHAREALSPEDLLKVEHVDAIVSGDAVGLPLAEEFEALRPFGMGNPGVRLLMPAARVSDVRPMGDGRHARFMVTSGGVRSRVVAFGVDGRLGVTRSAGGRDADAAQEPEPRHDLVARLEVNEWRGAVEPRLVLKSLHPLGGPAAQTDAGTAHGGCSNCGCRARGEEWWKAVWAAFDAASEPGQGDEDGVEGGTAEPLPSDDLGARTVVDRRARGLVGSLSDVLSTGESVLAVCADVSRRRGVLVRELEPARFGRPPVTIVSERCSARPPGEPDPGPDAFWLADHRSLEADRSLSEGFVHVFALDPPPSRRLAELLRTSAPGEGERFLHLGWGPAEIEFCRKAVEHDLGLRAPLAAVYRALQTRPEGAAGSALEALLQGEGLHPRTPSVVGRCLRVLVELGLVDLERSSATVKCTITDTTNGTTTGRERVELERSNAFVTCTRTCQEALRFLSEPIPQTTHPRAA